eukprot:957727-Amphidinium_carterae.3
MDSQWQSLGRQSLTPKFQTICSQLLPPPTKQLLPPPHLQQHPRQNHLPLLHSSIRAIPFHRRSADADLEAQRQLTGAWRTGLVASLEKAFAAVQHAHANRIRELEAATAQAQVGDLEVALDIVLSIGNFCWWSRTASNSYHPAT